MNRRRAVVDWRRRPRDYRSGLRPSEGPAVRVREARLAGGLTQEQLGAVIGRSRSYVLQIELGLMNPNEVAGMVGNGVTAANGSRVASSCARL
jgi:DNA-binding XRE family transcriptional regulator